jgi:Na+/H+-dicarboxylate symporter
MAAKRWYKSSTFWIFFGLCLGVLLGGSFPQDQYPEVYNLFRFLSKAFIQLIKGLIVPLLVSTIIVGIAQTGDIKAVGRMGAKALVYFEVVTTIALLIGLVIANVLRPGEGLPLDTSAQGPVSKAAAKSGWDIALHLFPSNIVQHAAEGDILPVVVFATLFGISLTRAGEIGKPVLSFFEAVAKVMFKYTDMVMRLTPFGVLGAMAYNVSHMAAGHRVGEEVLKGWPAVLYLLGQYARLVSGLYLALLCLLALVFVPVMWICGIRVLAFLRAIREPALTAFSTASSEAALPRLIEPSGYRSTRRRSSTPISTAGCSAAGSRGSGASAARRAGFTPSAGKDADSALLVWAGACAPRRRTWWRTSCPRWRSASGC